MTTNAPPMYTAIHHDRRNGLIFRWYGKDSEGNKTEPLADRVNHRFFTPNAGEYGAIPCGMKDIYGKEMYSVVITGEQESKIKSRHRGPTNYLAECDIDYRSRWLENHYASVDDLRYDMTDFNVCFLDIEVAVTDRFPTAEAAERPVNCVTIYLSAEDTYYVYGLNRDIKDETHQRFLDDGLKVIYQSCRTEAQLLTDLFTKIGTSNVDILTGWNCDWYDNPYLVNRAAILGVDIRLMSRLPERYRQVYMNERDGMLNIAGTEVLDYLKLFRKFTFGERDSYKLDDVGEDILGERKAPLPEGYHSYRNHWDEWVYYNVKDVQLNVGIDVKKRMIETTVGACSEARVPLSAIFASKKMLVGFILKYLHKRGLTFPAQRENDSMEFPGGYVYSTPGYYEWLVSYDYRSMYPSIMMGANISPETKVEFPFNYELTEDEKRDLVRSPWTANDTKQVYYRKDKEGIVPAVVRVLFDGRVELKNLKKQCERDGNKADAGYYDMKQMAYKIFGNSLYGLLGNPFFQLYDVDNSATVTTLGVDLITRTIDELVEYIETDFVDDPRYYHTFGHKPTLNKELFGTYLDEEKNECVRRLSHGDTDSFFVKYEDIYEPFKDKVGKEVEVAVFVDGVMQHKTGFNLETEEKASKQCFNRMLTEYCGETWTSLSDERKVKVFVDGYLEDGNTRIIYNRFCLTDYCRMLDTCLMEDTLAGIMERYAERWNYRENTLYLKREKCITQAIVTAKKKYICYVESNEDVKYKEPQFDVTGLEIVRSSTTPFSRKYILSMVSDLLKNRNKANIRERYMKVKREFFDVTRSGTIYDISIPSGVKATPPKYTELLNWPEELRKKLDWRMRAGSVWNHLIETDPILKAQTLEPIFANSKVKFLKVKPNQYGLSTIAYVGSECPPQLYEYFVVDWKEQWVKTFGQTMGRLFGAIGWNIDFEHDQRDEMVKYM
jgi:DNA polymerase elongation subunit (family B)